MHQPPELPASGTTRRPDLRHGVAMITGGLRGIGRATVLGLVDAGFNVAIVDQDAPGTEVPDAINDEVKGKGARLFYAQADVTKAAAFVEVVDRLNAEFGGVEVLVNNVGVGAPPVLVEQIPIAEWDRLITLNLSSAFYCVRAAVPSMKALGRGSIINISSQAGRSKSEIGNLPYAAAKAGILGFTRQLAHELGPFGIRVNAVAPGLTLNERVAARLKNLSESRRLELITAVPLGRLGSPEEIGAVVAFLAGRASSYITGATIDVNGGRFMM